MIPKKPKKGRPMVKDKMVVYAFTVRESVKEAALTTSVKEHFDDIFRDKLLRAAKTK
jgi:uncharacterized protein YihD (DUF1040 family)